jgi:adenylate cyclase class 2
MYTEYEATFININKDKIRKKLIEAGASLARKEFLQKRINFNLPKSNQINNGWLRVRDEGDKITMSLKIVNGGKIYNQKESQLVVDNFEEACKFLISIGCGEKAYQETKRELWSLDDVEISIDEWPFLEPFVEVEGNSEKEVRTVSKKIGFDYTQAKFCAVDTLYNEKYNVSRDQVNNNHSIHQRK